MNSAQMNHGYLTKSREKILAWLTKGGVNYKHLMEVTRVPGHPTQYELLFAHTNEQGIRHTKFNCPNDTVMGGQRTTDVCTRKELVTIVEEPPREIDWDRE